MFFRSLRLLAVAVILAALVWDTTRAPARQVGARFAISVIHAYQQVVAPLLGAAGLQCRFTPTCSKYAEAVIARYGLASGGWLSLKRVVRCGPWTPLGTADQP